MNEHHFDKQFVPGTHLVKPIPFKAHRMTDLSHTLLESHYENNYGGAVRRLNDLERRLSDFDWEGAASFDINGIKREELIASNSMLLHEVYFDSLGEDGGEALAGDLEAAIVHAFGSVERWRTEFVAMAKALSGGSGWVVLAWSALHRRLVNEWGNEHLHNLAGATPVLALDMYEHAYHIDFGANASAYVDAFMQNIHWGRASARFSAAHSPVLNEGVAAENQINVDALKAMLETDELRPVLLDVRHTDDRDRSGVRIPDTAWRDSHCVSEWAGEFETNRPVVVYCMYGFWVSQDAATELRAHGLDARSLAGGIAAWRAMGFDTTPIG